MTVPSRDDQAEVPPQVRPRRRGPGRPRVLCEAEIIDAALVLARDHGISSLSMRAVARQLGVPPMTIYGYVPSKEALDALVIDRIFGQVRVPGGDEGTWEQRLEGMLCDARRILVERPQLAESDTGLVGSAIQLLHRGAFGREATRLAEGVYDLLREGGFPDEDRSTCFVALFTYVTGYPHQPGSANSERHPTSDAGPNVDTGPQVFALGLRALIEGLKLTLRDTRTPEGRPR